MNKGEEVRELTLTELPKRRMTLRPATKVDRAMALVAFPIWENENDGRFVVDVVADLTRQWQPVVTDGGLRLEVRAASCGASCYCAGEFRFC